MTPGLTKIRVLSKLLKVQRIQQGAHVRVFINGVINGVINGCLSTLSGVYRGLSMFGEVCRCLAIPMNLWNFMEFYGIWCTCGTRRCVMVGYTSPHRGHYPITRVPRTTTPATTQYPHRCTQHAHARVGSSPGSFCNQYIGMQRRSLKPPFNKPRF